MRVYADRRSVDGVPVPFEPQCQPVPFRSRVFEQLAGGDEVEVAVVIEVRPSRLVGWRQRGQLGCRRRIREHETAVIAKQDRIVLATERRRFVDRREEQIEVAVVVEVPAAGLA